MRLDTPWQARVVSPRSADNLIDLARNPILRVRKVDIAQLNEGYSHFQPIVANFEAPSVPNLHFPWQGVCRRSALVTESLRSSGGRRAALEAGGFGARFVRESACGKFGAATDQGG